MGGLVTSHHAGMSVPDWPNSYHYNMFLFPPRLWVGGIFFEHTHRLMGSVVGLFSMCLAVWAWRRELLMQPRLEKSQRALQYLALAVFGGALVQGRWAGCAWFWSISIWRSFTRASPRLSSAWRR